MGNNNKCICEGAEVVRGGLGMSISGNTLQLDYSTCACGSFKEEFTINNCPMCGKPLLPKGATKELEEMSILELWELLEKGQVELEGCSMSEAGVGVHNLLKNTLIKEINFVDEMLDK